MLERDEVGEETGLPVGESRYNLRRRYILRRRRILWWVYKKTLRQKQILGFNRIVHIQKCLFTIFFLLFSKYNHIEDISPLQIKILPLQRKVI